MRLQPPKGLILGPAVRPNVGTGEVYRKKLEALIDEMNASILYWIVARWRESPPTAIAMDASWFSALRRTVQNLVRRWQSRFDETAPRLAEYFAKKAGDRPTNELKKILSETGVSVPFKISPAIQAAMGSIVDENTSLIKSIAERHLSAVRQVVMRSVAEGRDLGYVTKALEEEFQVPRRRAALIARDQNNKVTASITRLRQQEAGIERAVWIHSHAGKKPRPEHLSFSNGGLGGPIYDVSRGAFLEGVWTWPGVEINCRCFSRPLIPGS